MKHLLPVALLVAACDPGSAPPSQAPTAATPAATSESGEHHHDAPHGGTLVELGEHFASLELVLNDAKGELHAWFHDAHAERPVRLEVRAVPLAIALPDGTRFDLALAPVESALTGETAGDTSQFSARDPRLVGATELEALLPPLTVRGRALPALRFAFPSGRLVER